MTQRFTEVEKKIGRGGATMRKKMDKVVQEGRYRNGVYFCRSGRPVDDHRLAKYDNMCHLLIRKRMPALKLAEAGFDYSDLLSMCKSEVFIALVIGFDPVLAMTSTHKDPSMREKKVAEKLANPELALRKAEESIVYNRLDNFLRRTVYDFHPNNICGSTVSYDAILDNEVYREKDFGLFTEPSMNEAAEEMADTLLELVDCGNVQRAKENFFNLSVDLQQDVVEVLKKRNIRLGVDELEEDSEKKSEASDVAMEDAREECVSE